MTLPKTKAFSCACIDPTQVCIQSSATGRKFSLTNRERRTIETTWMNIANKETFGQDIFRHIFVTKPALRRLWGMEDESVEGLERNPKFLEHSRNFAMFLDVAVRSLSLDGIYVISLARTVGKRHVFFKEVSFDAEYWLLFKSAVMAALEPHIGRSRYLKQRWQQFVMFLVTEVKDAFNKEIQRIHSTSKSLKRQLSSSQSVSGLFRPGQTFYGDRKRKVSEALLGRRETVRKELREDLNLIWNRMSEEERNSLHQDSYKITQK